MSQNNGKLELVYCKSKKKNSKVFVKNGRKKSKQKHANPLVATIAAVKQITGIEGDIENFEIHGIGKNSIATVKAKFGEQTIAGRTVPGDRFYSISQAYINAFNEYIKKHNQIYNN